MNPLCYCYVCGSDKLRLLSSEVMQTLHRLEIPLCRHVMECAECGAVKSWATANGVTAEADAVHASRRDLMTSEVFAFILLTPTAH